MFLCPYAICYMICFFKCSKTFFKEGHYSERCPKYCVKRLTLKEMAEISIGKKIVQDLVCKSIPCVIKSNAVYVIAINYETLNNLSFDSFVYSKHSSQTQNVEIVYHHDNLVACNVVSTKNKGENIYKTSRQYSYASAVSMADAELNRTIIRFEDGNNKTCQYAIISYEFNVNKFNVNEFK